MVVPILAVVGQSMLVIRTMDVAVVAPILGVRVIGGVREKSTNQNAPSAIRTAIVTLVNTARRGILAIRATAAAKLAQHMDLVVVPRATRAHTWMQVGGQMMTIVKAVTAVVKLAQVMDLGDVIRATPVHI